MISKTNRPVTVKLSRSLIDSLKLTPIPEFLKPEARKPEQFKPEILKPEKEQLKPEIRKPMKSHKPQAKRGAREAPSLSTVRCPIGIARMVQIYLGVSNRPDSYKNTIIY